MLVAPIGVNIIQGNQAVKGIKIMFTTIKKYYKPIHMKLLILMILKIYLAERWETVLSNSDQ